jgi:Rieske Fe-S protein
MDRRTFMLSSCIAGVAMLGACASLVTHPVPVAAGRVRLRLADYPELARADGAIKILPAGRDEPLYVLANAGEFVAVSPICTHRGCTVDVQGARLVCPCHGSTYDRTGVVLKGPAQRALTRFPVTRSGDDIEIIVT